MRPSDPMGRPSHAVARPSLAMPPVTSLVALVSKLLEWEWPGFRSRELSHSGNRTLKENHAEGPTASQSGRGPREAFRTPGCGQGPAWRRRPALWGRPSRCRGSIAIVVLICLVLIASLAGALLRIGLAERQRLHAEQRRLQVEWLVESGLERAAARLAESGEAYRGETWEVAASELGGRDAGRVMIVVEVEEDPPVARPRQARVRVHGEYPREAATPARLTKQLTVTLDGDPKGATP